MLYIDCINDLEQTLNFKSTNPIKAKENKQIFSNSLNVMKDEFKTDVSTKFLMSFVKGDDKQKSNRVSYMLKLVGLNDRIKATNSFLMAEATTTAKNEEVFVYNKIDKTKKAEFGNISLKVLPMTSTKPISDINGLAKRDKDGSVLMVKLPCKVGITTRKLKTQTLHNIPL